MRCEPSTFHSITLYDRKPHAVEISHQMLKRLEDPNDELLYSVKHITVGYSSVRAVLPESSFAQALCNVRVLKTLTWRTWLPVSAKVLGCLHKVHPSARLIVIAHERNNLPLDETLLLSPQLHTLDIELSALYERDLRTFMGKSELKQLKALLVRSSSLEVLQIRFLRIQHGSKAARNLFRTLDQYRNNVGWFHFRVGETMPALKELVLRDFLYSYRGDLIKGLDEWEAWTAHQDWSALQRLDLRDIGATRMLTYLTGKVPLLRSLKIKMRMYGGDVQAVLGPFLQYLHHLTHLHLECYDEPDHGPFQPLQALFYALPRGLVRLYIALNADIRRQSTSSFEVLFTRCPCLQALAVNGYRELLFGSWTPSEILLSPRAKRRLLVRTAKHHSSTSSKAFPVYSFRYDAPWAGYDFMWFLPIQQRLGWLAYTDGEDFEDNKNETDVEVEETTKCM